VSASLTFVFPGSKPDHVRICWIHDYAAQSERSAILIEDGFEGDPTILSLPEATESRSDVPDVGVVRVDGDVGDPTRYEPRPEGPELHGGEKIFGKG